MSNSLRNRCLLLFILLTTANSAKLILFLFSNKKPPEQCTFFLKEIQGYRSKNSKLDHFLY